MAGWGVSVTTPGVVAWPRPVVSVTAGPLVVEGGDA